MSSVPSKYSTSLNFLLNSVNSRGEGGGGSGGAMVLGKLSVPGCPTVFTLLYPFSPLSISLWKTARYRLKYCL